jgi:hypothetical protein
VKILECDLLLLFALNKRTYFNKIHNYYCCKDEPKSYNYNVMLVAAYVAACLKNH